MKVGIAATMWRGLVDLPFPEFVEYCREAGADVMELSGFPKSYSGSLVLDENRVEQVPGLTRKAGIEAVGYRTPLCAQYEGPDQPGVYPRDIGWMRARTRDW